MIREGHVTFLIVTMALQRVDGTRQPIDLSQESFNDSPESFDPFTASQLFPIAFPGTKASNGSYLILLPAQGIARAVLLCSFNPWSNIILLVALRLH